MDEWLTCDTYTKANGLDNLNNKWVTFMILNFLPFGIDCIEDYTVIRCK